MRNKTCKALSHYSFFKIDPSNDLCSKTTVTGFQVRKWERKNKGNLSRRVLLHLSSLQFKTVGSPKMKILGDLAILKAYQELGKCQKGLHLLCGHKNKVCC